MGLPHQLLAPSKLGEAQASIQAGGDGVRDGVAMLLTAISEYNDMQGADGVNGSQVCTTICRGLVASTAPRCAAGGAACAMCSVCGLAQKCLLD